MCITSPIFASATASGHDACVVVSEEWDEEDPEDEEAMMIAKEVDKGRSVSSPGSAHSSLSSPAIANRSRLRLPSLRRANKDDVPEHSHHQHCEVAPEKEKGPVKGMAKKLINLAGRKAGPAPAAIDL
jgi:hypothetical protein